MLPTNLPSGGAQNLCPSVASGTVNQFTLIGGVFQLVEVKASELRVVTRFASLSFEIGKTEVKLCVRRRLAPGASGDWARPWSCEERGQRGDAGEQNAASDTIVDS
jgi:hypothetical protein